MFDGLLDVNIVEGPVLLATFASSAAALVYLALKQRTLVWLMTVLVATFAGAFLGYVTVWFTVDVLSAFGGPVDRIVYVWVPACFAAIALAIVNLWDARWWRKVIASIAMILFSLTATLGVNAAYGLQPTLGALLHISTAEPVALPTPTPDPGESQVPEGPLVESWEPPPGMPETGSTGLVPGGIPSTNSAFPARGAQVYLPPAALVPSPPRLPLVIMMMGQPGDPDPQFIATVLDEYAAANQGLAPIALVVDQLGTPTADPLCLDTDRGNVETYLMQDVVPWAAEHLHVQDDRTAWTVAGYSNGGQCAVYFGAKYPEVFGNILDISGVEYPGEENHETVLAEVFDGNQEAYDAVKPANIMAARAPYDDSVAIFTVGEHDPAYLPAAERNAEAAHEAGMSVTLFIVPGAGHVVDALLGGLDEGFAVLYPRLGLSK